MQDDEALDINSLIGRWKDMQAAQQQSGAAHLGRMIGSRDTFRCSHAEK